MKQKFIKLNIVFPDNLFNFLFLSKTLQSTNHKINKLNGSRFWIVYNLENSVVVYEYDTLKIGIKLKTSE